MSDKRQAIFATTVRATPKGRPLPGKSLNGPVAEPEKLRAGNNNRNLAFPEATVSGQRGAESIGQTGSASV